MMTRRSSRQKILDAAEKVAIETGAARLTLDAVAAKARVSKGGLLYNFPTKDALLRALVERLCARFDTLLRSGLSPPFGPAEMLLSYVTATLDRSPSQDRVAGGLLAAVAHDSELLGPMRVHNQHWLSEMLALGPRFATACVPWLAAEGLWLLELMRLSPFDVSQRRAVRAEVLRLAREAVDLSAAKTKRSRLTKRRRP